MGSKGGGTTTTTQKLPKEFLEAYKNSLKMAGQAVSTPYEAYQGQLVAGLNDTQLQGLSNVNAAQGMALPAISEGIDLSRKSAEGITPELYNQFYSPYVRDVADATQRNLMESNAQQMSGLKGGAIQAGAFGGDRGGVAQAEMARQQDLANGQTMANVYNQGYGQAMQLAGQQAQNYGTMGQQIAGLGVGAQGSVLQGAQAQMAAGAQQQATEQAQLSAAYDQWMQRLAYPYQQAQFYANIAQGLGSSAGGSSSTTQPGPSWGSQILGGLGALGSIFSLSDERMKEDIQPIGELFDGQTIYRYRLKGDPKGETRIGLMAQDVQKRKPRAVAEIDGVKGVDYEDATDDAAVMASAGGLVPPSAGRMGFADGGLSFYPYGGHRGWVSEGKIEGGGGIMGIPEPPEGFKDDGLGEEWYDMKPLTAEQIAGFGKLAYGLGIPTGGRVNQAHGGLVRGRYADGGAPIIPPDAPAQEFRPPSNEEIDAYVAKAAMARGIDPEVAVRLWRAEGGSGDPREGWRSKGILKNGKRESSYSPFQLNVEGGVGEEMIRRTGVDPSKPENWKPSVDFALDWGAKNGWDDWMAAKAIGLKPREGLDGARAVSVSDGPTRGGVVPYDPPEFVVEGEKPKGLRRFIAGDGNKSIIESIMGREMSPEARNAVMNASFALLAGRSPVFGVNLGNAGKVGMQTYYNALAQKRELTKQEADLARQAYEAKTGRMTVEVSDLNARRQQAALVLPIVRSLIALGQPVPPYLMNILNDAFPEGSAEREEAGIPSAGAPAMGGAAPGGAPSLGSTSVPAVPPPASGGAPAPGPAPVPPPDGEGVMPPADGSEGVGETTSSLPPANSQVMTLLGRLPDGQNPYALLRDAERAKTAGMADLYYETLDKANRLLQDYMKNGIPMPDGTLVPFPGSAEVGARRTRIEEDAKGIASQVNKYGETIGETQSSFAPRTLMLSGLRGAVQSAETGKFSEFKADLINAAASLGLAGADQIEQAEDLQTAMKYFAQGILDSGMKDKIGPQISNADLMLVAKGQGTVENLPVANRRIIGAMYGKLMYDQAKVKAWDDFVAERGGTSNITPTDIRNWERNFSSAMNVKDYVDKGIANTPVAGELSVPRGADYFKVGYKYVHPNGRVFEVKGFREENGKRIPDVVWVN